MLIKRKINWYKIFNTIKEAERQIQLNKANTINVAGRKICIAHTSEGFFAVDDKCPHNGASLGSGFCSEDNAIVCPVHRYRFDLKTGRAKSGLGDAVRTYPVEIRDNGIYIGIEKLKWSLFVI